MSRIAVVVPLRPLIDGKPRAADAVFEWRCGD